MRAFVADLAQLLGEFVEVESGKKNQRPQLLAAIAAARATLLIAKLDRLSRNAGFIFALRDSGVAFVCCDMPDANTLTVGLFAVIAQHEREMISKRTIDALAAKKARGAVLGTPANMTPAAIAKSLTIRQENAHTNQQNQQAARLAGLLHTQGISYSRLRRNSMREATALDGESSFSDVGAEVTATVSTAIRYCNLYLPLVTVG